MKVLVIGSGVIGSIYGAQFALDGHELSILAHDAHDRTLAADGIHLRDQASPLIVDVSVRLAHSAADQAYDLVIVAVRTNQLPSTFSSLRLLTGNPHLLFLGNNPEGRRAIPDDIAPNAQLGFPGISGSYSDGIFEYAHIPQQATVLEKVSLPTSEQIKSIFAKQGFKTQEVADITGWLAYHAVFISCISMALLRDQADAAKLGHDRQLLTLMCRSIEEGFRMLKRQGVRGQPRNLAILHLPLLRPIALRYWGALMRSGQGELYFGRHIRRAEDEITALAHWVLKQDKEITETKNLRQLLGST